MFIFLITVSKLITDNKEMVIAPQQHGNCMQNIWKTNLIWTILSTHFLAPHRSVAHALCQFPQRHPNLTFQMETLYILGGQLCTNPISSCWVFLSGRYRTVQQPLCLIGDVQSFFQIYSDILQPFRIYCGSFPLFHIVENTLIL